MSSLDAIKKAVQPTVQQYVNYTLPDRLEEKFQELRADPRFNNWSDNQLREFAAGVLEKSTLQASQHDVKNALSASNKPMDSEWSQYSYEEILEMEDAGVVIPEEFLKWAHSMQASNTVDYLLDTGDTANINDSENLKSDVGDAGNPGKIKTAKAMNKQVLLQEEVLKEATIEFERYSNELDSVSNDAQSLQAANLKQVQTMMDEFKTLDAKVKNGEELSQGEKARYGELGTMMDNQINSSNVQIENFTADFDEITKLMTGISKEAKVAQDYANAVSLNAKLITEYESKHNAVSVSGNNHIFDGTTGTIGVLRANSVARDFSVTSIENADSLQSATFESAQSIKTLGAQMKGLTTEIDDGNENVSDTVEETGTEVSETPEPVQNDKKIELPPTEDDPEIIEQVNKQNDLREENVFAKEEDLNDINSILKRQQRKEPQLPPQDVIIDV